MQDITWSKGTSSNGAPSFLPSLCEWETQELLVQLLAPQCREGHQGP